MRNTQRAEVELAQATFKVNLSQVLGPMFCKANDPDTIDTGKLQDFWDKAGLGQSGKDNAVERAKLRRIIKGNRIIYSNIGLYAALYHYAGVKQADPRQIPPIYILTPGRGGKIAERKWSDAEYREWLEKEKQDRKAGQTIAPSPVEVVADVQQQTDYLIATVAELEALVYDSSPAGRDQFEKEYGPYLDRLLGLLQTLVLPANQRERATALYRRLNSRMDKGS